MGMTKWRVIKRRVTSESYDFGSGVASSISVGDIFIYSCSAQLISFEIKSISKEVNCAENKYMNMSPSLIKLVTPLDFGELCMNHTQTTSSFTNNHTQYLNSLKIFLN